MTEGEKQRQKHKEKEREALSWPGVKQVHGARPLSRVSDTEDPTVCASVGLLSVWGTVLGSARQGCPEMHGEIFFSYSQDSYGWPRASNSSLIASVKAVYTFGLSTMNSLVIAREGQNVRLVYFHHEPQISAVPLE